MTTRTAPLRAAIYARYSTDLQSAASIPDQIRLCRRLCEERGYRVVEVIADEAMSGFTHLRPGYQRLQELAMAGGCDVLVAESLDRLSRDQEHIAGLHKRMRFLGVDIVTKAEGAITEMHIGLGGTMSALFLRQLAEKTHRGLEGRVQAGKSAGGLSYGYRLDRHLLPDGTFSTGDLVIDPTEAAVVTRIFASYARRQGWEIVASYHDRAVSGASMFRTGIEALSRDAQAGKFDVVLTEAMDRVSRSLADVAKFHDRMEFHRVTFHTITEGKIDTMLIGMKGTMNQIQLRDIGLKTARGQKGRVKAGLSAGGNTYGYDVLPGIETDGKTQHGARAINPGEAAVVRRIFEDYARGISPKKIAETLNLEGVLAPRGKHWSASTLHGNRERGTGLLNNELYVGVRVWNRLHYAKDPDTGKRVSRPNPEDILLEVAVPDLRIIDEDLWQRVRARQGSLKSKETGIPIDRHRRPAMLLSGLMRCGCCGSGFSKISRDGYGCSAARNKGRAVCTNMRVIKQADIEGRVLHALEHHLMDPAAVEIFCKDYMAERNRLAAQAHAGRGALEKELRTIKTAHGKLVEAIIAGVPVDQVKEKMGELDTRRREIETELAAMAGPDPVRFHPSMATAYRDKVGALIRGLGDAAQMELARESLRGLIEAIILTPDPNGAGLLVDLEGALAGLLHLALWTSGERGMAAKGGDAPNGFFEAIDIACKIKLVAGAGFEPAAFRL